MNSCRRFRRRTYSRPQSSARPVSMTVLMGEAALRGGELHPIFARETFRLLAKVLLA
jgi:hypothetical protein